MPSLRSSSLKRGKEEEEEDKPTKKEKWAERRRKERVMDRAGTKTVTPTPAESEDIISKSRSFTVSPTQAPTPLPPHPPLVQLLHALLHLLLPRTILPGGKRESISPNWKKYIRWTERSWRRTCPTTRNPS